MQKIEEQEYLADERPSKRDPANDEAFLLDDHYRLTPLGEQLLAQAEMRKQLTARGTHARRARSRAVRRLRYRAHRDAGLARRGGRWE